jgi:hypothetical protein
VTGNLPIYSFPKTPSSLFPVLFPDPTSLCTSSLPRLSPPVAWAKKLERGARAARNSEARGLPPRAHSYPPKLSSLLRFIPSRPPSLRSSAFLRRPVHGVPVFAACRARGPGRGPAPSHTPRPIPCILAKVYSRCATRGRPGNMGRVRAAGRPTSQHTPPLDPTAHDVYNHT